MDSFMPGYARPADYSRVGLLLTMMLMHCACGQGTGERRFEIDHVDLKWSNGRLTAVLQQQLALSDEAKNALRHGVPLTFRVQLIVRDTSTQTRVTEHQEEYEIRYLPLSDRFQLTLPGGDEIQTFPRLRHLVAELADLRLTLRTGALPDGSYEVLTRTRLDRRKMPMSMRFPSLFSSEWKHDSGWSSWPLELSSQA